MSQPLPSLPAHLANAAQYEVVGYSERSFSGAAADAVARAGELFAKVGWAGATGRFEVLRMKGPITGGKRTGFEIKIRVGLADPTATTNTTTSTT